MAAPFNGEKIDAVVGIEARGFILGGAIAEHLECGFIPIRKKGKLPWKTIGQEYTLEYGVDVIEIHEDAIEKDWRVLIVDDLIATGGTAEAAVRLSVGGLSAGEVPHRIVTEEFWRLPRGQRRRAAEDRDDGKDNGDADDWRHG